MGGNHSSKSKVTFDDASDVNFDHFQILRAIGKGSFGKVCIVQKKDTQRMYAMKYMNKNHCVQKDAVRNVIREIEILTTLDHPFLVNLWFSFHDEEDMFMVVDLLLGGDLRYHMQHDVQFDEDCVKLYVCEIALALDYLQYKNIIHRDIKPDNILLDEEGHVHITDFNIATVIREGQLATSMSGTKPYIAPEVFECAADACPGYSFPVDWWSLGICAYEMLKNKRPFDIHSGTNISEVREMFLNCKIHSVCQSDTPMNAILCDLICVDPLKRISSLKQLREKPLMSNMDFDAVLQRKVKPSFVPAKDHLNCDPTFELEEMIIESKPLHKKKKRLSKQNSRREQMSVASANQELDPLHGHLCNIQEEFTVFNREKEMKRQALEKKEREWQEELERFMMYDSTGSNTSKKDKSHHSLGVRKAGDNKENKKHSPQSNSKMISPTVTRRFPRSKRLSGDSKDGGSSSLHPREKEEIQKTLAEAGKLLAIGAVEPLVMLSSASSRATVKVDKQSQAKTTTGASTVHKK